MKKTISLVKVLFKLNLQWAETKKKQTKILLFIGLGCYLLFIFSQFWRTLIQPLQPFGQAEMARYLLLHLSSWTILMTSVTYVVNILYFSNDMENLIPFPFQPREILSAKLIVAYLYELMIATMLALPGFLAYGLELQKGALYYFLAWGVYVLLPIVPVMVSAIFFIILTRFFKIHRYQNVFKILTTVGILVAITAFQMQLNANMLENGDYDGNYILTMSQNVKEHLPFHLQVASQVIEKEGSIRSWSALGVYILFHAILIGVTIVSMDKLYAKSIGDRTQTAVGASPHVKKNFHQKKPMTAIVMVELKKLFRNVTYFIQCVLPTSFMPAIILITMFSAANQETTVPLNQNPMMKILFATLIMQFFMMMNQISATAISRDGREEASFYASFPVNKDKIVKAKAQPSIYVGYFNLAIALMVDCFVFELMWWEILELLIIGILLTQVQSYLFILLDLNKPKLKWESEMAVIKHNMNVLKAILLWFVIIIATALWGNAFLAIQKNGFAVSYILLLGLALGALRRYIKGNVEHFYEKIY